LLETMEGTTQRGHSRLDRLHPISADNLAAPELSSLQFRRISARRLQFMGRHAGPLCVEPGSLHELLAAILLGRSKGK
jgi:hypothetical protein